ncbi:MAG TPA: hypothetical protein PLM79_18850 [Syntrophobacteraceae bacterium]|nr:hypothetical protein [Syntrophobacteraceae bacterium]
MPKETEFAEPQASETRANLIPIRQAYFPKAFWDFWDRLDDRQKAAYILGWICELEMKGRRTSEQVQRINDHLEDDGK